MVGEISPIQQYNITVYVIGPDSNNIPSITNTAVVPTFSYNNTTHYWGCSTTILTHDITNEVFSISANDFRTYNLQGSSITNGQTYNISLPPSHLYKWTNSTKNISYYTSTPTPTTNSFIYNATGDNVTNTYIYGGDTQAYFSSSNNTTMVYNIVWGSPAQTYSASLPIGGSYMAGGINGKE